MKKYLKRAVSILCALVLIGSNLFYGNVEAAEESSTSVEKEAIMQKYTDAVPGTAPNTNIPEGYVFAGWYADEERSEILTEAGEGWAKFVDENIFLVKSQITAGTTAVNGKADIRFITTVDTKYYQNVGFVVTINGKTKTILSDTVYKQIYAVGATSGETITYNPKTEFSSQSEWFMTYTLRNVPNISFGTVLTAKACWTTQDGTVVYGKQVKKTINMGIFETDSVDEGMILNCDSKNYLVNDGGTVDVTTANYKEGTGAFKSAGSGAAAWWTIILENPVDISAYKDDGELRFWLYVKDIEEFEGHNSIYFEISSSSTADYNEYQFNYAVSKLKTGWNEVSIAFNKAYEKDKKGETDFSAINRIRFLTASAGEMEVILDDVRAVSADGSTSISIVNCDSTSGLRVTVGGSRTVTVESCYANAASNYQEGAGALEVACTDAGVYLYEFNRGEDTVDISDYSDGQIHFWIYVNDVSYLNGGSVQMELSSSGACDTNELQWSITGLKSGWNEINRNFSQGTATNGAIDYEAVNYVRLYLGGGVKCDASLIVRLDDVRAVKPGTIFSCDNETYLSSSDGTANMTVDDYIEGMGALRCKASTNVWYDLVRTTAVDVSAYQTGRLHFGLYVNNTDYLGDEKIVVELGSAAASDAEELEWYVAPSELTSGWNVIELPISVADSSTGTIDLQTVDHFSISQEDCKAGLITVLDDVRAVENEARIAETLYDTKDVAVVDMIPTELGYAIDATGVDDSTAGIQEALDDCYAAGGGTVYLPAGTYKVSGAIRIPPYVTLHGDWNDPDEVTANEDYGTVISVEMEEIEYTAAEESGVFELSGSAGVVGLTVYYPNQNNLDEVKVYPYTFYVGNYMKSNMLFTIRNVTVLNGYRGIGATTGYPVEAEDGTTTDSYSHESLQIENFKGTFLECGIELYHSSDVGTVNGVTISNDYWEAYNSRAGNAVDLSELSTRTNENTVGMRLGDVEWTEYTNISIKDCKIGIQTVQGRRKNSIEAYSEAWKNIQFVGSFYDLYISNCITGLEINYLDTRWGMVIAKGSITECDCGITGDATYAKLVKLCGVTVENNTTNIAEAFEGNIVTDAESDLYEIDYDASYTTPTSKLLIANLSEEKDASSKLQRCLNKMEKLGGGIVYVPAGTYSFYSAVSVPAGVELRGATSVATREEVGTCEGTLFLCYYSDNGGSTSSTAFITLAGENAGLNGIRIIYADNGPVKTTTNTSYATSYAVRGKASGVYIVNSMISAAGYGVDFRECDNHYIKGVTTCCYYNSYYLGGEGGTMIGCLQNGTVLVRTASTAKSSDTWISEADAFSKLFYPILKKNCHYILLENAENEVLYNNFAYGVMTMLTNVESYNTQVINLATDKVGASSAQLVMDGGSLFGVNILHSNTTAAQATDTSMDGQYLAQGIASKAYKYIEGDFELHNRLVMVLDSSTEKANEVAITTENVRSIVLLNCDSVDTSDGVNTSGITVTTEDVKEGTGAFYMKGTNKVRCAVQMTPVDISMCKNGQLHLWFYVNKTSYLASSYPLLIKLGSDATAEECTLEWSISLDKLSDDEWTELVLDLTEPTTKTGTIDYSAINYLKIYQDISLSFIQQNSSLITKVDHIYVTPAEEDSDATSKVLFDCDSTDDMTVTSSGAFEITSASGEFKEETGTGAFKTTGAGVERWSVFLDIPVNIKAYGEGKLHLDLYINSMENFTDTSAFRLEIGSSRRADCEEMQWQIPLADLTEGWNSITLDMTKATETGITHLGVIDYFRIYHTGTGENLVTILDNVYVTKE